MTPTIGSIRIVRHTLQFERMRAFYQDGLDMRPIQEWDRAPDDRGVIVVFNGPTSATAFELLTHPGAYPGPASGLTIGIEVANAGAYLESIQERGMTIARPLETMPWGHLSFIINDPDGLEIAIFQDLNKPGDE